MSIASQTSVILERIARAHLDALAKPNSCDPIGQLQVGNEPEIGNGRKMAGEMAGGHFSAISDFGLISNL